MSSPVERAKAAIADANRIVVLTGAGISTESGIPDFRGPQGLWTKDPDAEKLSDIRYYVGDPDARRRSWQRRSEMVGQSGKLPNEGHRALIALEASSKLDLLVTQNIDGLHHAAGSNPALIVEIHGNVRESKCLTCGDVRPFVEAIERVRSGESDPPCLVCGGILKSATVSFGQQLNDADLERSFAAAESCDLLLAVGTTLAVRPIAHMAPIAVQAGAALVILNGEETEMDDLASVVINAPIGETLPAICH